MPLPAVALAASAAGGPAGLGLGGIITLGSALLSGVLGLGESPSEEAFQELYDELYSSMPWLKETAFSKEELFDQILPAVQNTFRRGADVAAAKIGSTIPETSGGAPEGQAFMDYYINALAPQIAEGEKLAGQAHIGFVDLWNQMDSNAKTRFMQAIQIGGNLAGGLAGQTPEQGFVTNALQGADISSTIQGNVALGQTFQNKATDINSMLGDIFKQDKDVLGGTNQPLTTRPAQPPS